MTAPEIVPGSKFGRLTVIGILIGPKKPGKHNYGHAWLCQCDCGNVKESSTRNLSKGRCRSCGCWMEDERRRPGRQDASLWKRSGKYSNFYNPDLTDEDRVKIRSLTESRQWTREVYKRDDFTCVICGQHGGKLNAHHLNCWARFKEQRFDLDNGVTLCKACHLGVHCSAGGPHNPCTKEDFIKFKKGFKRE